MPPLSFWDKMIYWIIMLVLCACYCFMLLGTIFLRSEIAFQDEMVVASEDNISFFWFLPPFLTFFLMTFITWYDLYHSRKPIFGLRNFKYGPPAWPKEYPLFMRSKPYVYVSERKKKERRGTALLLLVVLLVSFIPYPWSLYGRDVLYSDGSIVQYSMFNSKTHEYSSGKIASVEIEVFRNSTGKSNIIKRYDVQMTFTTDNGRKYCFTYGEFRGDVQTDTRYWLTTMLQIKKRYIPEIVTYTGVENLEKVVSDHKLTDAEREILYQLFDQ